MKPLDYASPDMPVRSGKRRVTDAMFVAALVVAPTTLLAMLLSGNGDRPIPLLLVTGPIGVFLVAVARAGSPGGNVWLIAAVIIGTPILYAVYAGIITAAEKRRTRVVLIVAAFHVACAAVGLALQR